MSCDVAMERNTYRARLIALVYERPLLWDKTTADFNNRLVKMDKWQEVSTELNVSTDKIRRTWENLRDQFRRDLKRQLKYGVRSKWRFYDDMSFIRNMVRVKELTGGGGSDSDELDTLQEDYKNESLSTIIATSLNQSTLSPKLEHDSPSTSAAAAAAGSAATTSVIATTPNFARVQLSTQWQAQLNNDDAIQISKKARRDYEREQLACRQLQEQARQQYDLMKQNKEQRRQQQQQQLQLRRQRQLQQQQYQEQQLQEQQCESSDENNFDADFQAEIPELVKIEIDSDTEDHDFMSRLSPSAAFASAEVIVPTPTVEHKDFLPTPEEACVTTSGSTSVGALKRSRQSDECANVKEDTKFNLQDFELPDEDYHFVMSVLPSLRQIPRNRKFPLRMNIMNLISQELLEADEQD